MLGFNGAVHRMHRMHGTNLIETTECSCVPEALLPFWPAVCASLVFKVVSLFLKRTYMCSVYSQEGQELPYLSNWTENKSQHIECIERIELGNSSVESLQHDDSLMSPS